MIVAAALTAALTGEQVLARAKEVFRAHVRPAYVTYVLERRDTVNGNADLENSYDLKIWCRTSDRSALTRRYSRGRAHGELVHATISFDGRVDPGPPTADIFERDLYGAAAPAPDASNEPRQIGGVSVAMEVDYRVTTFGADGSDWHLHLEPRRDAWRNRIDDLWVDQQSFEVHRMRVRDHLYVDVGPVLDDEFDVRFATLDGVPLIASIHGMTRGGSFETDYRFLNVTFPAVLPAWYFDPKTYGLHAADAPA